MERFGYIITNLFCDREYFYIHNVLYVDIVSCIENVHIRRNTDEHVKIVYFKILTNSEIERFLHEEQTEEKRFGFCQLTRYNPTEKFKVYSSLKVLFENIQEPAQASKQISWSDVPDSLNFEAKFGNIHTHTSRETISLYEESLEELVGRALTFKTPFHQFLEGSSKKMKIDISEKEKNSVKHKTINKRLTRSERESDVESINDEYEKNSLFGKNRKPWSLPTSSPGAIESPGALNQHEKYDVTISDDLRLAEEIPPLSVYVGAGFAAEIKTFLNADRYRAMITNFFLPELNNHDVQELWFQQDGATCHTARATIDLLKDTFGDRLISRFGPVNWSYVQSLVYANKPQTLDHLEDNIRRVIANIRPQMLEKVIENWTSRLDYIRGSPMPEIIFKM
ncbi:uncharacterized protein TNCV_5027951 [Trichonephila clavipes]|nr:uncharacterized protein TNCV_5027951 [Trichonephila clavipes]